MTTTFAQRVMYEQRHLERIARNGYASVTLPIVFGGVVLSLLALVGFALALTLIVAYWV
jgi:hypothetical protein